MTDDLFDQLEAEVETAPSIDPEKDYFEELVGEGKRYRDPKAAGRAIVEKDSFIEQLKRENAEMRQSMSERINMEEFLKRIETSSAPSSPSVPDTTPGERDGKEPALTPEAVQKLLEQHEAKKAREANIREVQSRLKETFGTAWKEELRKKAEQLGISTLWLSDVAGRSPQAFFQFVGVPQTQSRETFVPPPRSAITHVPTPKNVKDYKYWQEQRQSKGENWYFSIPVTQERIAAMKELGDAFDK